MNNSEDAFKVALGSSRIDRRDLLSFQEIFHPTLLHQYSANNIYVYIL